MTWILFSRWRGAEIGQMCRLLDFCAAQVAM
ncbi:hypothetical protein AERO8C_20405 [Aeromonas veronii]|uniref:Uncharacterized protein n=1 Tax=Aeromonas veronii TaxID=654 RepID=A0A653L2K4_AERVE|nr:hypothetical protein AERO8C_20405 [Aeromonas veronii]